MIMCPTVFNVWPKTTLLLPVWLRDAKRLDTPARACTCIRASIGLKPPQAAWPNKMEAKAATAWSNFAELSTVTENTALPSKAPHVRHVSNVLNGHEMHPFP